MPANFVSLAFLIQHNILSYLNFNTFAHQAHTFLILLLLDISFCLPAYYQNHVTNNVTIPLVLCVVISTNIK